MNETGTVRLHRALRAPPERVRRALRRPGPMATWLPPQGCAGRVQRADARVGGSRGMAFARFPGGRGHATGGGRRERGPNARPPGAGRLAAPDPCGVKTLTGALAAVPCGRPPEVGQSGTRAPIPVEACCPGRPASLAGLGARAEPDVRD